MKDERNFCITFCRHLLAGVMMLLAFSAGAQAQTTAFTYQGKLADSGSPANGNYDLQFKLFDAISGGTQQGTTLTLTSVAVAGGIFSVTLDFGNCSNCLSGADRFLEVAVRPTGGGTFTALSPRQQITSTPYAVKSLNAAQLNGFSPSDLIQNTTTQQVANFTISGTGSANIFNAATQYNLNGLRIFTVNGAFNNSGTIFTASNTFTGDGAGLNTTPNGSPGSSIGKLNSFYGAGAGQANNTGEENAFFGAVAGSQNTTGFNNAFFGYSAGRSNTSGTQNAFLGALAGQANTTGNDNAFFGYAAGSQNTAGFANTFIGEFADFINTNQGASNTLLGFSSKINGILNNATAIGSRASVTQSDSLVLGSINGVNGASTTVKVGIGTTAPTERLHVVGNGIFTGNLTVNGTLNAGNSFIQNTTTQQPSSNFNISGNGIIGGMVGIGTTSPAKSLHLSGVGSDAAGNGDLLVTGTGTVGAGLTLESTNAGGRKYSWISTGPSAPTGPGAFAARDVTTGLYRLVINNMGNVGIGVTSPLDKLHVAGDIRVGTGGGTGCVKDDGGSILAGTCSSDARFKRDILPFTHLLDKVAQLQPVHFYWRSDEFPGRGFGAKQSYGLIAQEVEKVLPELVTEDEQGYKAVNYSKLPLLSLQAIKELKAENDALKAKVETLSRKAEQLDALKKLVCADHPDADLCKQPQ